MVANGNIDMWSITRGASLSTINNDFVGNMVANGNIDMWSITRGASLSALINLLISFIHGTLYNPNRDGNRSAYNIKTRKIITYSNLLATGSNTIVVAFSGDLKKLDVGGMLITLKRLITDQKFITNIKKDFLQNEMYKQIVGSPYDFMI